MMKNKEVWKDIPGCPYAQVSNMGNLKRIILFRGSDKVYTRLNEKGYVTTCLTINGVRKMLKVHRLVAAAFIKNPLNLSEVHHKKGVKTDNRATELEWITHKDNCIEAAKLRRTIDKDGERWAKNRAVIQVSPSGNIVKRWAGQSVAARYFGISPSNIQRACVQTNRKSASFYWRHEENIPLENDEMNYE